MFVKCIITEKRLHAATLFCVNKMNGELCLFNNLWPLNV